MFISFKGMYRSLLEETAMLLKRTKALSSEILFRIDVVHSFNDPLVALQEFKPDLYHLVIIDILMPKMNGFELYDRLRKLDSKVKICFLTTASEIYYKEIIKEAFPELEVSSFISKPIANKDLVNHVKEVLELK